MRFASRINVNPYAHEDPPRFAAPLTVKNHKGVFSNQSGLLTTLDKTLELFACARCHLERRRKIPHSRFELTMGQVHRSDC